MPAPFAALEGRVNGAVTARLANRLVSSSAGTFDAIFEAAGALGLDGLVATTEPRLTAVPKAIAAQLERQQSVTVTHPVTGVAEVFELARDPEPDGGGMAVLYLRKPPVTP
ncbi:hypothetical protein [Pseudacidovorax intermedius]|uniref:hypothetical protein n=1 Tax=Pseudacidovorax intermedius TaxID=433924 RepID=UPI0026EC4F2B|nr:hypothetical protein [Pseudacidovorax intermedius]